MKFHQIDPFPVVFGQLNLTGSDHRLQWHAQQPFRPFDLLCWGTDHTTWIRSFTIGMSEQLVEPLPFQATLRAPWFPVEGITAGLPQRVPNLIDGVKLPGDLKLRVNPGLTFATASPGVMLRLHVTGALEHAIVYGVSVD